MRRCASSRVVATYAKYVALLGICAPCLRPFYKVVRNCHIFRLFTGLSLMKNLNNTGGSVSMRRRKVLKTNSIVVLFVCFALICGCTPAVKNAKWTCFYLEEGKDNECRNYYDQSSTRVLEGSIASIEFVKEEFKGELSVEKLCQAIKADGYHLSVKAPENSLEWLNDVLRIPDLQEKILEKKEIMMYTPEIKKFTHLTMKYHSRSFGSLNEEEQKNILRLNRLMLENLYEKDCPKAKYIIIVRVRSVCNEEEKKDYLESRKKDNLPMTGYEDMKYSIFELDIDCIKKLYRTQGQFDYNSKDQKLEGRAFPFSEWMNIDNTTEGIYQKECNGKSKKMN